MTARPAAALTLGTGSSRRATTAASASATWCLAITFAAISRTRHASSVVALMMAGAALSAHAYSRPRAAQTRGQ